MDNYIYWQNVANTTLIYAQYV